MRERPRIAVTGASGFVGVPLVALLESQGCEVLRIGRPSPGHQPDVAWDPEGGHIDATRLEGLHAAVHLAGESLAQRWTNEAKRKIRDSRIYGTTLLARALAGLSSPPKVLVSGSAVGAYGDRGDEVLDEESRGGRGFLAGIVEAWEKAADPARDAGIRVVHPRLGIVLHSGGGALARLVPIFRLGIGGRIGSGRQWMSWVARTDAVAAIAFVIRHESLHGPVNVTAPTPVRNEAFTRALGDAVHRPAVLPVPEIAVRTLYGEMGVETVIEGQRVLPKKLLAAGFDFRFRTLPEAFQAEIE